MKACNSSVETRHAIQRLYVLYGKDKKGPMEDFPSNYKLATKSTQPVAIVSQLLQHVARMRHIDELFGWITNIMMVQFDATAIQVWASQAYTTNSSHIKLRATSSRHPVNVLTLIENTEVCEFIKRILYSQQGLLSVPVNSLFSQQQAMVLSQQGCLYWTVYFIRKDFLLELSQISPKEEEIPTPLRLAFSFFTQQPIQASQARAISFLVEQTLRIAINHDLLSTTAKKPEKLSKQKAGSLVPEHVQMLEVEQAQNPFNSAIVISEKKNRQIYNLMDGKKSVAEIAKLMHLNQDEVLEIVYSLLEQGYIKIQNQE